MFDSQPKASQSLSSLLANGMLLASLLPYLSPVPLSSDVQLVTALLAIATIFVKLVVDKKVIRFTSTDLLIFLAALVYLVYVRFDEWREPGDVIRKTSAMMLGAMIYFATRLSGMQLSPRVVFFAAGFHLFAATLQEFSPSTHSSIIKPLLGQVRVAEDRGVGGACSEPSFLANIAILLPICAWIINDAVQFKLTKFHWIAIWGATLGLIALSQAGTASVYGLITLVVFGLSRGAKSALATVILVIVSVGGLVVGGDSLPKSRATELVQVAVKSPRLIIEDPSASMRLVGHYLSGPSLLEKPLGNGLVKLDLDYFWLIWNKYNLDSWYEVDVSRISGQYYAIGYGLTDVGANTLRMGWFFIAVIATWFWCYRGSKFSPVVISFVLLGVFSSIPIVFPAYWLLLGLIQAERERKNLLVTEPQSLAIS